jgi:hypothetical protein
MAAILAFEKLSPFIPDEVPLILESPVAGAAGALREIRAALEALPPRESHAGVTVV